MISVVIPSFNSAEWLPSTLDALKSAIEALQESVEVVLVDDGSSDGTIEVLRSIDLGRWVRLRIINQANSGRFIARWVGLNAAEGDEVVFLDSRTIIDGTSLVDLRAFLNQNGDVEAINSLVRTDASTSLLGLFWEVPVRLGWGAFLREPHVIRIQPSNFDRVPKGTTLLYVRKSVFRSACEANWPSSDPRFVSDDTAILRNIAAQHHFVLVPRFSGIYRPRVKFMQFIPHTFGRGRMFIDSHFGHSMLGTFLVAAMVAAPILTALSIFAISTTAGWQLAVILLVLLAVGSAGLAGVIAIRNGVSVRSFLSFALFVIPFVATFWAGLVSGAVNFLKGRFKRMGARE